MADMRVGMGVDGLSGFKSAMQQAQASVKALDAELKTSEKAYKASGDAETYMAQKTKALQAQIAAQKNVLKAAEDSLRAMAANGVDKASVSYQRMVATMQTARGNLIDMESQLANVGSTAEQTGNSVEQMADSVSGIGRKMSLETISNGLGKIQDMAINAAKKIGEIGTQIWNTMTEAAAWGDNELTLASMYGIDTETLQRMQKTATLIDTEVDTIIRGRNKLMNNMASGNSGAMEAWSFLGISLGSVGGKGGEINELRDWTDVFWETGEALMAMKDATLQESTAQAIFGRGWDAMRPLFDLGANAEGWASARERYDATMKSWNVTSGENVNKLGELDDAVQKLQAEWETLSMTATAMLSPAFTELANSLTTMLANFNDYLATEEGQEMMDGLNEALNSLFDGIKDIDFGAALETVKGAFETIKGVLEWLSVNGDAAGKALVGVFTAVTATKAFTDVAQVINSAKTLFGSGGAGAGAGAAAAAGGAGTNLTGMAGGGFLAGSFWTTFATMAATAGIATIDRMNSEAYGRHMEVIEAAREQPITETVKGGSLLDRWNRLNAPVQIEPDVKEVQEELDQAGFSAPLTLVPTISERPEFTGNGRGGGGAYKIRGFANGISDVPVDSMLAVLHRGERVVTAQQNHSYTANSNLYVESMIMNNGMDANALAAAMAAQQRRTRAGFGS